MEQDILSWPKASEEALEALFIDAVSAGIHGRRVQWEPLSPELWPELFRLAEEQKLLPLLTDAVCQCPDMLSEPLCLEARRTARRQVMLQARKDAAFLPVLTELRRAGIETLVIKGCLCRSVYPNGALRISADEDLLVEEDAFAGACRVLSEAGFLADPEADPGRSAEIGWHSPDGLLCLELHRRLFAPDSGPFGLLDTVFSDLFSRARTYSTESHGELRSLSPHDHLLYLLLHAMKHFIRTGFGLRQICDVGLWAARWTGEIDWMLLDTQTRSVSGRTFCAALFALAEQRLGISLGLPPSWREDLPDPEPMLRDLLEGGVYGSSTKSRAHTARITQDAVAAQRQGKRRSLRTALFPPARDLEGDYPALKAHPALLPLIWQKRLARYLLQSSRTDSPSETLRLGKKRLALLREYGILEEAP